MSKHTPKFIQPQFNFDEIHHDFITLSNCAKDITGQRFGRLVALGPVSRDNTGKVQWLCTCECGNTTIVRSNDLHNNHCQSCGCLRKDKVLVHHTTHGMSKNPFYFRWAAMVSRCNNPMNTAYKYYGQRGISVCDEWKNDFLAFHSYVSQLPHHNEKGYSLDRIDNDGNYEPGNVRYATRAEQNRNKRRSITDQSP